MFKSEFLDNGPQVDFARHAHEFATIGACEVCHGAH
jgi:hypothetical protein